MKSRATAPRGEEEEDEDIGNKKGSGDERERGDWWLYEWVREGGMREGEVQPRVLSLYPSRRQKPPDSLVSPPPPPPPNPFSLFLLHTFYSPLPDFHSSSFTFFFSSHISFRRHINSLNNPPGRSHRDCLLTKQRLYV